MAPMVNSTKHLILKSSKLFQKQNRKEYSSTHSMSPIMTLIPKPDKTLQENKTVDLMLFKDSNHQQK